MTPKTTVAPPRPRRKSALTGTLSSDVYAQIRADILHCRLAPDSRLRFKDLRARYKSGLSPLREALMRLAADKLVVLEDHKGFCVAPVSPTEMKDLATTLFELESLAIRRSIQLGDDRWEANILARFHVLSKRDMFGSSGALDPEWEARNVAFHESLYAACESPSLIFLCQLISDRFSRYRRLRARQHADPTRDVAGEHEEIMRAVIARDGNRAVAALHRHRMQTLNENLASWDRSHGNPLA